MKKIYPHPHLVIFCSLFFAASLHAQTFKWALGSDLNYNYMESCPITVDNKGNVYELANIITATDTLVSKFGTLSVVDSSPGGNQSILVSADSAGVYRWALASAEGYCQFNYIGADAYGYVYVSGSSGSPVFTFGGVPFSGSNYFCAKITSSGSVVWIKPFPSLALVNGMCVSPSGNIYVAGFFTSDTLSIGSYSLINAGGSPTTNVFVAAFDSSGSVLWARSIGGPADEQETALALTGNNEVYLAGTYASSSIVIGPDTLVNSTGTPYPFVCKFDPAGVPVWGRCVAASSSVGVNCITADNGNNLCFTGEYGGGSFIFGSDTIPSSVSGLFVAKYDSLGHAQWAVSAPDWMLKLYSIVMTQCNNIWVSGQGANVFPNDSMFVASYNDTTGALQASVSLASGGDDANAIVADNFGNLYIGGDYLFGTTVIAHDTLSITDSTSEALFIIKMHLDNESCSPAITATETVTIPPGITLYPNPANDECTIQSGTPFAAGSSVTVYDMEGRAVHTYPLSGNSTTIPTQGLPPGIYLCSIHQQGEDVVRKLVVMR